MKILVTGANGFIGIHLVEKLTSAGHDVRCFVKSHDEDQSFLPAPNRDIVYGDLKDPISLKESVHGIDTVYHLAAIPKYIMGIPDSEYIATNVIGTTNLLEACRLAKVNKFIFVSTIEAAAPSLDGLPLNEQTEPRPANIYGRTKLDGEKIVSKYYDKFNMHTIIVRPPMTYGPREFLLLKRLFKIVTKGFFPIIGNGKTLMEFCYVKNLVQGIILAGEKGIAGQTYFISDERSYSIEEVVLEIAIQLDKKIKIVHIPPLLAWILGLSAEYLSKILRFYPFTLKETGRAPFSRKTVMWMSKNAYTCDISKAKKELGYSPIFTLSEGIKETVAWYKKRKLL